MDWNTTTTTNTHFFSKHQSGDDVTGSHSEILGQIHCAALIVDQHLKTAAFRHFGSLPAVRDMACVRPPFSVGAPVSLSRRATTACSSAGGRCGRGGGGPSTPRCSPPERWCGRRLTLSRLRKRPGKVVSAILWHTGTLLWLNELFLPVYETDLPAKSDHFFTSASLMTSPLLSTTMAAGKHRRAF